MEQENHKTELVDQDEQDGGQKIAEESAPKSRSDNGILWASGIVAVGLVLSAVTYVFVMKSSGEKEVVGGSPVASQNLTTASVVALQEEVAPSEGVTLPITWGNLGQQLTAAGVIDEVQFKALYAQRGGLPPDMLQMLDGSNNGQIKMTPQNAGIILNMLWALGLGQNSAVLIAGPMVTNGQAKPSQFASTGGWTLAVGNAMDHYAKHNFFTLTPAQEQLVESVAKNIYRPCCGNSTYFPDCNHGMAMLGLLELMASQGATADQMYQTALTVNSYWFPDTYLTIAKYLQNKGVAWNAVKPEEILSATYSSAQGYQQILSQTAPVQNNQSGGNGCGA